MKFYGGIRFRLFLLGFIPAGIAVLCLESYYVHNRVADLEQTQRRTASLVAQQIAALVADHSIHRQQLAKFARSTFAATRISRIELIGADRKTRMTLARPGEQPETTEYFDYILRTDSPIAQRQADTPSAGDSLRIVMEPVPRPRSFITHGILIALASLIPTLLLIEFMEKKISKPIEDLTRSVSSLTRGNLGTRSPVQGSGEIRALQNGFNSMAATLQKNQAQMERKIYTATVRLQQTLRSLEEKNLKLEEARENAVSQNNTKSRFLAHVSHEIRTPMNGIMGFVELLSKSAMSAEQKDQLQLIESSAANLLDIINEVLDLSTLESEEFSLSDRNFNLRPFLEDTVSLLSPQAGNIRIILSIDHDFPAGLRGDPIRIQQIMTNLLGNALKFTSEGRIVLRARRFPGKDTESIFLSVSDTGCGIAEHDQNKLFSPFQRLSEFDVSHGPGTGLGLSICKNIVEHMNGQIGVVSRYGTGSTFWIRLPLAPAPVSPANSLTTRIDLVDPDTLQRHAVESQLRELGAPVSTWASVNEYLQSSQSGEVVLCCLDSATADLQIRKLLAHQQTSARTRVIACAYRPEINAVKSIAEKFGIGFLGFPCRTRFLKDSLQNERQPATRSQPAANTSEETREYANHTILVADDNEINRALLKSQLIRFGTVVLEARDGKETLELVNAVLFDLIFLDLQMPVMHGLEVISHLRTNENINRSTPVVAVTAHALSDQIRNVLDAGFNDCLIKPVLTPTLSVTLGKWLERSSTGNPDCEPEPAETGISVSRVVDDSLERTEGDAGMAEILLRRLFSEMPDQLEHIENRIGETDYPAAEDTTHKLHGSFSFLGLEPLRKTCGRLETSLKAADSGRINREFHELKRAVFELVELEEQILLQIQRHQG